MTTVLLYKVISGEVMSPYDLWLNVTCIVPFVTWFGSMPNLFTWYNLMLLDVTWSSPLKGVTIIWVPLILSLDIEFKLVPKNLTPKMVHPCWGQHGCHLISPVYLFFLPLTDCRQWWGRVWQHFPTGGSSSSKIASRNLSHPATHSLMLLLQVFHLFPQKYAYIKLVDGKCKS